MITDSRGILPKQAGGGLPWLVWLLILVMICGMVPVSAAADKPVVNLFLLAGQSNMAGADSVIPVPPRFQPTAADLAISTVRF